MNVVDERQRYIEAIKFPETRACIIFDLDGTLVPKGETELTEAVVVSLRALQKRHEVWILTNGFDRRRAERIAEMLQIPLARTGRKPFGVLPGSPGLRKIVVGDKLLTDGLAAARGGATFMHIRRKVSSDESFLEKLICALDDVLFACSKVIHAYPVTT